MTINTYANLKQAIENWSHRTDISNVVDNFIELAENEIDKRLMLRNNEFRATATMSTSDRFLALPDRFLKMRRLTLINGSLNYEIEYRAPEQMNIQDTSGKPKFYTVSSQLEFDRTADSSYTLEMSYYSRIVPLTSSNTSNDTLTDYPDLYLWGCLTQLALWEKDNEQTILYQSKFDRAIEEANKQERKGRFGTAPRMMKEGSTP
jgi:hypothetical protein